jgi:chromosome partitioning protein
MEPKMLASNAAEYLDITVQAIHKQLKTKELEHNKNNNRVYFGHNTAKSIFNIDVSPTVLSSQIVKGGTGKTTLLFSLAIALNLYGLSVLCVDLDQQANLSKFMGIDAKDSPVMIDIIQEDIDLQPCVKNVSPGLDILPSRIENAMLDNVLMLNSFALDRVYRDKIDEVKSNYDFILIDCPPSLGQSVTAAALASDCIITPVNPEKFATDGLNIVINEIRNINKKFKSNLKVKIVLNKFDIRTNLSHLILTDLIKNEPYGSLLFPMYIRLSQEFPNSTAKGQSVFDSIKNNSAKEDIDLWAREIIKMYKKHDDKKSTLLDEEA